MVDLRQLMQAPRYTTADAARYLKIPIATLRSWVAGRSYQASAGTKQSQPLILRPAKGSGLLSYSNLVEAHVLRALRTVHAVSMRDVRNAISFAETELGIERLLLSQDLRTTAGSMFLEQYSKLVQLDHEGQLAIKAAFEAHLERLDDYQQGIPLRLFPFTRVRAATSTARIIAIDPRVSFGQPTVASHAIRTSVIALRLGAGEQAEDIAQDYDLSPEEVREAASYERAA